MEALSEPARERIALLTAGRMPATVAMARILHRAGFTVIGTDSLTPNPLQRSRCVQHWIRTPSPRSQPEAFVEALIAIGLEHGVTDLLPMYEEGFVVARHRHRLEQAMPGVGVLLAPRETLALLDDKMRFITHCRELELPVPATCLATSQADLLEAHRTLRGDVVVKPVISRFASAVVLRPDERTLRSLQPTPAEPWVAQQFLEGEILSSYGLCRQGKVVAHGDYAVEFVSGSRARQGVGASGAFRPVRVEGTRAFAETLFGSLNYHGQYGLDFIRTADGVFAIECNPRSTSGLHMFERSRAFGDLLRPGAGLAGPTEADSPEWSEPRPSPAVNHPQILQALASGQVHGLDPRLWRALLCRDVLLDPFDPGPFWGFLAMVRAVTALARREGVPVADRFFDDLACDPR